RIDRGLEYPLSTSDPLESLLERAAPRPEPPSDVRERVRVAVEREWRRHKRRRWHVPAALAALLLVALGTVLLLARPGGIALQVSHAEGVRIEDEWLPAGVVEVVLAPSAELEARGVTRLTTASGTDVRLRGGTRLTWQGPELVVLDQGTIY